MASLRRQDLPAIFHRNGAVYVFGLNEVSRGEIITGNMLAYEMPSDRSQNIDSELDLRMVELLLKERE